MEQTDELKEVDFHKYCKACKHEKAQEHFDPCNECLENFMNVGSRKPTHYEEK